MKWGWAGPAASAAVVLAGAWLSVGAPQLTAFNAGLEVAYPWPRGAGAVLAGLGAIGLTLTTRRWWARIPAAALAVVSLWAGIHLLRYRVSTDGDGITARSVWGTRHLAWPALTQVENGPGLVVLRAGENILRLDVTDFRPEDRATLDRTIARRVREKSTP
jgi:hypothetical protein